MKNIKKLLPMFIFCMILSVNGEAQFGKLLDKGKDLVSSATEDGSSSTANGLKEALNQGVDSAVKSLSAKDGYFESPYRILIHEDARKVTDKVKKVPGFGDVEEKLIAKMNEAAELAAKEATPIFVGAIKNMSIKDASSILFGDERAATSYLEANTNRELYKLFLPIIRKSLDEVNANAYWESVVSAYNKIPFTKDLNPALDDHVTNTGLNGMYALIGEKEKDIRNNPAQRTTDLLKSVFSKQD